MKISGVDLDSQHPRKGGGFADIFRGSHKGQGVALKKLRVFTEREEKERLHTVGAIFFIRPVPL